MLSEEKISHLAHLVQDAIEKDPGITCKGGRKAILKSIKSTFSEVAALEEAIHLLVEKKLRSYTRKIVEGSSDWEILYDKTYREEIQRKGL